MAVRKLGEAEAGGSASKASSPVVDPKERLSKQKSKQGEKPSSFKVTSSNLAIKSENKSHSAGPSGSPSAMTPTKTKTKMKTEKEKDAAAAEGVCVLGPEFQGDVQVSTSLPSRSTLDKTADLPVFDIDGRTRSFKSLYWSESKEKKRVMVIFIRHFFCGNCQEYLRTLSAAICPTSLPSDTAICVVGCGSHTLVSSYIEQTKCPYPVFADPSKKLYSDLGMVRTLSLGSKDPDYIRHSLASGMVKSIAQGLKRIGSGDVLQAGDMKQVGGEFLFEVTGSGTPLSASQLGNASIRKVEVTWCHRMRNTRDHAELPELRKVLQLEEADVEESSQRSNSSSGRRRSEASWRGSSLARSLSGKGRGLTWSRTRGRSGSAQRKNEPRHSGKNSGV